MGAHYHPGETNGDRPPPHNNGGRSYKIVGRSRKIGGGKAENIVMEKQWGKMPYPRMKGVILTS